MIERSSNGTFELKNKLELFKSFRRYSSDLNLSKAFDNLVEQKLLFQVSLGSFILGSHAHIGEIRRIKNIEPIGSMSKALVPMDSYFKGYSQQFTLTTQNSWPHRGTYFCCTKEDDPSNWKIIYRADPTKKPNTYYFGSLIDENSRVIKMWKTILEVWNNNDCKPIFKKMAEDNNQKDFGNNRQAGSAAFEMFRKFGWIHEVDRKGKQIFYQIDKPDDYLEIIKKKIPICPRCGMPAYDNYCLNCNLPV